MRTLQPDLIFLDVQLVDDIRDWDLLNILKQEPSLQHMQVVMMGFSEPPEKLSIVQAGANDYLLKPIQVFQLESILMRYLNHSDFRMNETPI